jgi:hypothetical protein
MKPDDFEQRVQRQPLRQVPAGWRDEILAAADAAAAAERNPAAAVTIPAWRLFFARISWAGGAFAALWVALISLNLLLAASDKPRETEQVAAAPAPSLAAWNRHRAALQQLASEDSAIDAVAPGLPATKPDRPRSERRPGWQGAEAFHAPLLALSKPDTSRQDVLQSAIPSSAQELRRAGNNRPSTIC